MAELSITVEEANAGTMHAPAALLSGAGVTALGADSEGGGWIAVTGEDRVRWLNGMVTNSVQALSTGEGAYSFLLNAQGRIQGDCTVWAKSDLLLLQTSTAQVEGMMALLDRFIIMDDVNLSDESGRWHGLLVAGPLAAEKLGLVGILVRPSKLLKMQSIAYGDAHLTVLTAYSPRVPRFELWSRESATLDRLRGALLREGVADCAAEEVELLRIAEGTPRFGVDLRVRDLPQETAQTRALHFNKGCYLGQEIVERIRSRGNVHRTFTRFALHGDVPAPGTPLLVEDKPVGELTSIASALIDGQRLALGFVRREALERGSPLTYTGGTAEPHTPASASAVAAS